MDTTEIIVTISGVLLIALNFWFFFGGREETPQRVSGGAANPSQTIYACPMHPWITSTDPTANCSLCGMKLVKRDS